MPIRVPAGIEAAMQGGLAATSLAIGHYAKACRMLRKRSESEALSAQLDGSIRRLESMRRDLAERSRHSSPDALFIGLNLAEAGLSSLTDAVGEMRQACWALFPHPEPEQGWFVEPAEEPGS